MTGKEKQHLKRLEWIARLTTETCPGGVPVDDRGWRDLVNRIVRDVRSTLSDLSDLSDGSDKARKAQGLLHEHGGYRNLRGFQVASIIYDATRIFCGRFVSKRDRTHDQMVQAARSGRQNIAEGSMAAATSKKSELKLTNVAKASLEELLLDYEDYLRQNRLRQWDKNDPEALVVRNRYRNYPVEWFKAVESSDGSKGSDGWEDLMDPYDLTNATAEVAANTLLCLINQAIYLLKRQLDSLEKAFLEEGGFTERIYRKRHEHRRNSQRHGET